MYALLKTDTVFAVRDPKDPVSFFRAFPKLVSGENWIIGLACYTPEAGFQKWLRGVQIAKVQREFDFRKKFPADRIDYPEGGVFYFSCSTGNLSTLSDHAERIQDPLEICDHLIAFSGNESILSFHDAFYGDDMLITSTISEDRIKLFCQLLDTRYEVIPNPQRIV